jgi:hypothetical protein
MGKYMGLRHDNLQHFEIKGLFNINGGEGGLCPPGKKSSKFKRFVAVSGNRGKFPGERRWIYAGLAG